MRPLACLEVTKIWDTEPGMEIRVGACFFNRIKLDSPLFSHWISLGKGEGKGAARMVHFLILLCTQGLRLEHMKVRHSLFLLTIDSYHTTLYRAFACVV